MLSLKRLHHGEWANYLIEDASKIFLKIIVLLTTNVLEFTRAEEALLIYEITGQPYKNLNNVQLN